MFPWKRNGAERSNTSRSCSVDLTGITHLNFFVSFQISFNVPPIKNRKTQRGFLKLQSRLNQE